MPNVTSLFTAWNYLCTCLPLLLCQLSVTHSHLLLVLFHFFRIGVSSCLLPIAVVSWRRLLLRVKLIFTHSKCWSVPGALYTCFCALLPSFLLCLVHILVSVCFLRFSIYNDFLKYRQFPQNTKTLLIILSLSRLLLSDPICVFLLHSVTALLLEHLYRALPNPF